ncbi:MAG TPA: pseudouridine synthase [Chthoniobacteraceae bacterium]|jgi:23S rRNA pseudouridine2605 synthase|nr:pseudouridine synthase [Chthoniobacteraceae bacterium]
MRLNRFLASAGLGSRRGVETLIKEGRVKINGRVIEDLATQVSPQDVVKVGQRVVRAEATLHVLLYKPRGFLVTASDELERRTIFNCLPPEWPRVFHVGRLDRESEGLLILTNDGDLSLALTHPRYKIDKEYEVTIDKPFDPSHKEKLLRGFHIIGGRAKMESVTQTAEKKLRVVLRQGIKRQIRLMMYEMGYEVERLVRIRIGPIRIGDLEPGQWRMLGKGELAALREGTVKETAAPKEAGAPRERRENEQDEE